MAKYITLDGLTTFLSKLKDSVCVKLKTNAGLAADSDGLSVKLKAGGGLAVGSDGLRVSSTAFLKNAKLNGVLLPTDGSTLVLGGAQAIGPVLTDTWNSDNFPSPYDQYNCELYPHRLTYLSIPNNSTALNTIYVKAFYPDNESFTFEHSIQYFLQIKTNSNSNVHIDFLYDPVSSATKPTIYWANDLSADGMTLEADCVYEFVFTRPRKESTFVTAAWSCFKK